MYHLFVRHVIRMKSLLSGTEVNLQARMRYSRTRSSMVWTSRPPISIEFEIRSYLVSGLHVRQLKAQHLSTGREIASSVHYRSQSGRYYLEGW